MKGRDGGLVWSAYAAVCVLWGSTYLAIRIGVQELPPLLFAGIRFLVAGSLILLFAFSRRAAFPTDWRAGARYGVVGLFLLLGGNGLVVVAEQWVNSGIASLMVATVPLFMAIIEFLFMRRETLAWRGWLGLLVGFAGVGILVFSDGSSHGADPMGLLLLIGACISWAAGSVYSKTLKPSGSVVVQIGIQMLAGGAALSLLGLLLGEAGRLNFTPSGLWAMAYLVVFGSIIGYSAYIYVLQKWPAAKAGTYAYVNPVIALLLGAVILQEPLTLSMLIATVVILLGVLMVQTSGLKAAATSRPVPESPRDN